MEKLSQLNLNNKCIYSGFLALGCIIKGKTINHQAISTSIFTNLQRIGIENIVPIGNGIFNANNMDEAQYLIERHKMSRSQLRALKKRPYFRDTVIEEVITEGENYTKLY